MKHATLLSIVALAWLAPFAFADDGKVSTLLADWKDADRDRTVPVKIYYPQQLDKALPVIIVSHGLGGSREGLKYVGEYWAGHGYISVHLQHVGSDESLWKGQKPADIMQAMKKGESFESFMNRVNDVKFAIDQLERLNKDPAFPLHGKLDLDHIAMAGHSFGAVTTQAICGQSFAGGRQLSDPRVKVGIIFSPSPPRGGDSKQAFSQIAMPLFHWTGTKDQTPAEISTVTPAQRREPFDAITAPDQYLVVLTDADHMLFGGRAREGGVMHKTDAAWIDLIQRGSTAFLDSYLKGDAKAKAFLTGGDFAKAVKPYGTYETKGLNPK
jgi:predicted dienelactone hydrolase